MRIFDKLDKALAARLPFELIFAEDINAKGAKRFGCATPLELYTQINAGLLKYAYQVADDHVPVKCFVDMEYLCSDETAHLNVVSINGTLEEEVGSPALIEKAHKYEGGRRAKGSEHLIWRDVWFESMSEQARFWSMVVDKGLPALTYGTRSVIDLKGISLNFLVYTRHRCFRLCGCSKFNDPTRKFTPVDDSPLTFEHFFGTLLTPPGPPFPGPFMVVPDAPIGRLAVGLGRAARPPRASAPHSKNFDIPAENKASFEDFVQESMRNAFSLDIRFRVISVRRYDGGCTILVELGEDHIDCPLARLYRVAGADRDWHNNHGVFFVADTTGYVSFGCWQHDQDFPSRPRLRVGVLPHDLLVLLVPAAAALEVPEVEVPEVGVPRLASEADEEVIDVEGVDEPAIIPRDDNVPLNLEPYEGLPNPFFQHQQYLHVTEEQFANNQCLLLLSACGTGKTQVITNYLKSELEKNSATRVLFISVRKSLAHNISQRLKSEGINAIHYKDDVDVGVGLGGAQILVVQLESLMRVGPESPYDIVIIDEMRSLLGHMISPTLDGRFTDVLNRLIELCGGADKFIGMDADIDSVCANFCAQTLHLPVDITIINTYKTDHNTYVECTKKELHKRFLMDVDAKLALPVDERWTDLVLCGSKRQADLLATQIGGRGARYLLLTSATADEIKKKAMEDPNNNWGAYEYIICTPTMTVGVDVNRPGLIKTIYMFASNNSCCARDYHQMLKRVRDTVTVYICFGQDALGAHVVSPEAIAANLRARPAALGDVIRVSRLRVPMRGTIEDGLFFEDSEARIQFFTKLLEETYLSKVRLYTILRDRVIKAGGTVVFNGSPVSPEDRKLLRLLDAQASSQLAMERANTPKISQEEASQLELFRKASSLTTEQNLQLDLFKLREVFGDVVDTPEFHKAALDNPGMLQQAVNFKRLLGLGMDGLLLRELDDNHEHKESLSRKEDVEGLVLVKELFSRIFCQMDMSVEVMLRAPFSMPADVLKRKVAEAKDWMKANGTKLKLLFPNLAKPFTLKWLLSAVEGYCGFKIKMHRKTKMYESEYLLFYMQTSVARLV